MAIKFDPSKVRSSGKKKEEERKTSIRFDPSKVRKSKAETLKFSNVDKYTAFLTEWDEYSKKAASKNAKVPALSSGAETLNAPRFERKSLAGLETLQSVEKDKALTKQGDRFKARAAQLLDTLEKNQSEVTKEQYESLKSIFERIASGEEGKSQKYQRQLNDLFESSASESERISHYLSGEKWYDDLEGAKLHADAKMRGEQAKALARDFEAHKGELTSRFGEEGAKQILESLGSYSDYYKKAADAVSMAKDSYFNYLDEKDYAFAKEQAQADRVYSEKYADKINSSTSALDIIRLAERAQNKKTEEEAQGDRRRHPNAQFVSRDEIDWLMRQAASRVKPDDIAFLQKNEIYDLANAYQYAANINSVGFLNDKEQEARNREIFTLQTEYDLYRKACNTGDGLNMGKWRQKFENEYGMTPEEVGQKLEGLINERDDYNSFKTMKEAGATKSYREIQREYDKYFADLEEQSVNSDARMPGIDPYDFTNSTALPSDKSLWNSFLKFKESNDLIGYRFTYKADKNFSSDDLDRAEDPERAKAAYYMTDPEFITYLWLCKEQGDEYGEDFLKLLKHHIEARERNLEDAELVAFAQEHEVLASIQSIGDTFLGAGEWAINFLGDTALGGLSTTDETRFAADASLARATVANEIDWKIGDWDAGSFVYNTFMSMADSVVAMSLGGNYGGIFLGASAAGQATNAALERGLSGSEARLVGLASGISEMFFETYSIGKFNALKQMPAATFGDITKNIGRSVLTNATEEMLTEISNLVTDYAIAGEKSQFGMMISEYLNSDPEMTEREAFEKAFIDASLQVLEAGGSGALMGVGFGSGASIASNQKKSSARKNIETGGKITNLGNTEEVISRAEDILDPDVHRSIEKVKKLRSVENKNKRQEKKLSREVGRLYDAITDRTQKKAINENKKIFRQEVEKAFEGQENAKEKARVVYKAMFDRLSADEAALFDEADGESVTKAILESDTFKTESAAVSLKNLQETFDNIRLVSEESAAQRKLKALDVSDYNITDRKGDQAQFKSISFAKDGAVLLNTEDGAVSAMEAPIAKADAVVISGLERMREEYNISDQTANYIYHQWKEAESSFGTSAETFILGAEDAFTLGTYSSRSFTDLSGTQFAKNLPETAQRALFQEGARVSEEATRQRQAETKEALEKAQKGKKRARGKVIAEDGVKTKKDGTINRSDLTETQRANLDGIELLALESPINWHVFRSQRVNGKFVAKINGKTVKNSPNGMYISGTNDIWIDLNAGDFGEGTMLWTAAHEISHYIRERAAVKWKAMADFVMDQYAKGGVDVNALLENQKAKILDRLEEGEKLTEGELLDRAYEELISDSLADMLTDGSVVQFLAELKQKDEGLWNAIKKAIADLLKRWARVIKVYEGRELESAEARALASIEGARETLQQMYAEAFAEANAVEEAMAVASDIKSGKTSTEVDYGMRAKAKNTAVLNSERNTAQLDRDYMDAVKRGDMETAQRMVDEAAREAGYTEKVYHGTVRFGFTKLDAKKGDDKISFFAAETVETAQSYTKKAEIRSIKDTPHKASKSNTKKIQKNLTKIIKSFQDACTDVIGEDSPFIANRLNELMTGINRLNVGKDIDYYLPMWVRQTENDFSYIHKILVKEKDSALSLTDSQKQKLTDIYEDFSKQLQKENDHWSAEGIYGFYANTDAHLVVDCKGKNWNEIDAYNLPEIGSEEFYRYSYGNADAWTTRSVAKYAKAKGYSGVTFRNVIDYGKYSGSSKASTVYAFFEPEAQVKSAEPVTYNAFGRVIPLSERFNKKNKDIRYQQRNADSNRRLLADALESTAQTKGERALLSEYKELIGKFEAKQAELDGVNAALSKLYSQKGKRDMAQINELRDQANKLANSISKYDQRLLTLESTKTLKDVVERERKVAAQKQRERTAQILKRRGEGRERTAIKKKIGRVVSELNRLFTKPNKKQNVKIGLQETVGAALKTAEVLFSDEFTDDGIIRRGFTQVLSEREEKLAAAYADALKMIDKYDEAIAKLKDSKDKGESDRLALLRKRKAEQMERRRALNKKLSEAFEKERKLYNKAKVDNMINELADVYEKTQNSEDEFIKRAYDPELSAHLRDLVTQEYFKGATVQNMTADQLQKVYKAYKMVLHAVRTSNKLFRNGRAEDLAEREGRILSDLQSMDKGEKETIALLAGAKYKGNGILWNLLEPWAAFERLGSESFTELFWDMIEADNVFGADMRDAAAFKEEQKKKHNYSKWKRELSVARKIALSNGRVVKLTLSELMAIYAYSKRNQAENHMEIGGFVPAESVKFKDKKFSIKKIITKAKPFTISSADVEAITKEIEKVKGCKEYVDEMQAYLSETMGEKGNESSRILYGDDLFLEKFYFPLKSQSDYVSLIKNKGDEMQGGKGFFQLKNTGIAKETDPKANNPIVLQDFNDIWNEHVELMSNYHSYVVPLDNIQKIFGSVNAAKVDSEGKAVEAATSVRAAIKSAFGQEAVDYFSDYLKEANGGATGASGFKNPLASLFGKGKKVAVLANLSVMAQQYFAIIRAQREIDTKYFTPFTKGTGTAKEIDTVKVMKTYAELIEHAPIAVIKEIGGHDIGMQSTGADYLDNKNSLDSVLGAGSNFMDKLGWATIWWAVKKETQAEKGLKAGTPEFWEACKKRFGEVIVKTQVYRSTNSQTGVMRSKSDFTRAATSFMGEPLQIVNGFMNAIFGIIKNPKSGEAWRKLLRTARTYIPSMILTSFAAALVVAGRDDDEDEAYLEKLAEAFGSRLTSDLNPLGLIPWGRDVLSIWEGWDVTRPDMDLLADFAADVRKWFDDEFSLKALKKVVFDFANLSGVPVSNIYRDAGAIFRIVSSPFDDIAPERITEAFFEGLSGEERSNAQRLYDSWLAEDDARYTAAQKNYKNEKSADAALKKKIKQEYVTEGLDYERAYDYLLSEAENEEEEEYYEKKAEELGISIREVKKRERENEAYWTLDEWDSLEWDEKEGKFIEDEDYSKYSDLYAAVERGKNLREEINRYLDHGASEKDLRSQITEHFKPIYKKMTKTERAALKGYLVNAYEMLGKSNYDAHQDINAWLTE